MVRSPNLVSTYSTLVLQFAEYELMAIQVLHQNADPHTKPQAIQIARFQVM
jgi:hypothetical protein